MFNQEISLEEWGKFYRSFRGFRLFVFRYRIKNENAELAENYLQHVYRKLHFPNSYQMSSKAALVHMSSSQFG